MHQPRVAGLCAGAHSSVPVVPGGRTLACKAPPHAQVQIAATPASATLGQGTVACVALFAGTLAGVSSKRHCRFSNRNSGRTGLQQSVQNDTPDVAAKDDNLTEDKWGELFNWKKAWYPMAVIEDLDSGRPTRLQLLGEDLVAWKSGDGNWRVFEDRCPHRNVPLSEGRVESDGTLFCSYHGWRFNGEGKITAIPQATDEALPKLLENPRACAAARPTQVRQGVLWVWGETSPDAALESALAEPTLPEELSDPEMEGRASCSVWSHRDIPYGWEVAFENVTDPSHVDVAHHNIVSNRYTDPCPTDIAVAREPSNKGGFKVQIKKERKGPKKEQLDGMVSTMDFRPPCQMHIKSEYPTGASLTLLIYFVPTKPGWSRLVGSTLLVKGKNGEKPPGFAIYSSPLPRWLLHLLAPSFLHQDQVFLHFQQLILQKEHLKTGNDWKKSYWIPTPADKATVTLRRWLDRNPIAWSPAVSTEMPTLPDRSLLFDTYKTHTEQCTTCSTALSRISKVQSVFKYSAIVLGSAGLSTTSWPMMIGGAMLGLGAGVTSRMKAMFHEVPFHHQDNN